MSTGRPRRYALRCLLLFFQVFAGAAYADVFRPAYLELREVGGDHYDVVWKVPAQDENTRLSLWVRFPDDTRAIGTTRNVYTGNAIVERTRFHRPGGLSGQRIRIAGRAIGVSDVIARVERLDGTSQFERLALARPEFTVEASRGGGEIAWSYLALGVEHILGGVDHLLFVLAMLLIVRGSMRIVATVTAFTIAHSLTLAAVTMGWMHVPGPPVEAMIALSIVFVAAEVVHGLQGKTGLTARAPWLVAFCFGLLHGFGFAGALAEVGLPQNAVPVALLMFNVGVEVGQLMFVTCAVLLVSMARRAAVRVPRLAGYAAPYAIGTVAMFWVIERVASFWL